MYRTIDDLPEEGKVIVNELIQRGIIESRGNVIELKETIYEVIIILAKLGII